MTDHRTQYDARTSDPGHRLWTHPGGKLRELGPKELTLTELLAVLISTGHKGKSAEQVAAAILQEYPSIESLAQVPIANLLQIKGLGDVKILRIAAALELARRSTEEILMKHGEKI